MKKIIFIILIFLLFVPLTSLAQSNNNDFRPYVISMIFVLFSLLFFYADIYIIIDKLFSAVFTNKHLDPFHDVTNWKDYYQHLSANFIIYLMSGVFKIMLVGVFFSLIVLPLTSFMFFIPLLSIVASVSKSVANILMTVFSFLTLLFSWWFGIFLIRKFINCSFRQALMSYLIKLIPVILIIFVAFAFTFLINKSKTEISIFTNFFFKNKIEFNANKLDINCNTNSTNRIYDDIVCRKYNAESCPNQCEVCPPCPQCSSLGCRSIQFCEDIDNVVKKSNLITVNDLQPRQTIASPLAIKGEAKGSWFFEGEFPISLVDDNGKTIATTNAQTKGDWMTDDFIFFQAELKFVKPATEKGTLILSKSNPSDLPENSDQLIIPIQF